MELQATTDPYNYPYLQKTQTMYLSTISKQDFKPSQVSYMRESSFQKHDIPGTTPRQRISKEKKDSGFSLSTFVEPIPDRAKHLSIKSNPLYRDDIQGTKPAAHGFVTTRSIDPLCPVYKLPTPAAMSVDPGRPFIRDTLNTSDINNSHKKKIGDRGRQVLREPIPGSQPSKLIRQRKEVFNLEARDINKDGIFETSRSTNPLNPTYHWRDSDEKNLNASYGNIAGTNPRRMHPIQVKASRPNDFSLNVSDIEGTRTNSCFSKAHFLDKRRQFQDYMNISNIEKAQPSTLKKGIDTKRQTNPLMPSYKFPGHSQIKK